MGPALRPQVHAARRLAAVALAAALSILSLALADVRPEALAPGDTGTARTAGPGNTIEIFPITVLGVLDDAGVGFPLVLIRAEGDFIERSGGVAAGMSGSPVYIDVDGASELLGAIGYVFPQSDHQLALVTPIGAMRSVADRTSAQNPPLPIDVPGLGLAHPVATPVLLGGVGPRAAALLNPLFATGLHTIPVQTGTAAERDAPAEDLLVPGSAISVQLVRGDITIGAVGTVTVVEEDRLLAFGHPLLGTGETSLPFAPAFVTAIVASTVVPFKLANSGTQVLGEITQDRPAAIAGSTTTRTDLLPVAIVLGGAGRGASLSFEVVPDERLFPVLVAVGTLEAIDRTLQAAGGGSARLAWEIELADGPPIRLLDQVSDAEDLSLATARAVGAPLQFLARNPFRAPSVRAISLHVELGRDLNVADIVEVRSEADTVAEGGELTVHVRLQPFRQEARVESFVLQLPAGISGPAELRFRGGRVDAPDVVPEDEPPLLSFAELIAALEERPRGDELVIEIVTDEGAERLDRRSFPFVIRGSELIEIQVGPSPDAEPDAGADPEADGSSDSETPQDAGDLPAERDDLDPRDPRGGDPDDRP